MTDVKVKSAVRYGFSINLGKVARYIASFNTNNRFGVFSAIAPRVSELVRSHLSSASASRHETADRLGANRTGFLEKGARSGVTPHATADEAEVLIRVPGISRAFRDLTVTPKNANALTIPLDALAYNARVSQVRALGWSIFRPKGKNVLMGTKDGETKTLYALVKSAHLRQDRGLLPADEEISSTAKLSIKQYLQRRFAA